MAYNKLVSNLWLGCHLTGQLGYDSHYNGSDVGIRTLVT